MISFVIPTHGIKVHVILFDIISSCDIESNIYDPMACVLKHFALSPQQFPKTTEMISRVLKTVSSLSNVEISLICHFSRKNIIKKPCRFNESLLR